MFGVMASAAPSAKHWKLLVAAVIVAVFIPAGAYGAYAVLGPKPDMTLVDTAPQNAQSSCGVFFRSSQQVGATFTIVNTGKADGFVTVNLSGGGGVLANDTYFVKAGQSVQKTLATNVDCSEHFVVSVWIEQVRGA
jgi:hypothetical protein